MPHARALTMAIIPLALTFTACSGPSPSFGGGDVEPAVWTIPFESSEGGCAGTVEMTGAGWAVSGGELVRGRDVRVDAYCDALSRYQPYVEDLDLTSIAASVFPEDACADAPAVTISGQPGVLCERSYDDYDWITAMSIVGDNFVMLEAQLAKGSGAADEVRDLLRSATITTS